MQLKAKLRSIAKDNHISMQLVLQNFMLERLLERISISEYRSNLILKGGFLIASIVELNTRTTMDMDITIKSYPVDEKSILNMFNRICNINLDEEITFIIRDINKIRIADDYNGYRITFHASYPPMKVPLKVDITTGDKITPREVEYDFKLLLENRSISVLAYNLETVLAEKLESVIVRGDQNTRMRDYYDIFILMKLQLHNIDFELLRKAFIATVKKRNSLGLLMDYQTIIIKVKENEIMHKHWKKYQRNNEYAKDILFKDTCEVIQDIMIKITSK